MSRQRNPPANKPAASTSAADANQVEEEKYIQRKIEKEQYDNRQHITRTHVSMSLFLLYILMLLAFGSRFFKDGFLLTRVTLDNETVDLGSSKIEPKFTKSIIVLIDALKYEFISEAKDSEGKLIKDKEYLNQFEKVNELLSEKDNNLLFKFIADAPTTTLQRIKGLTTGSLPTFIDAGANFNGGNITEDNIISQLVNNNKSIAFLGDDTWLSLYPNKFDIELGSDSFNVWDLDTVDNNIFQQFDDVFYNKSSEREWDVIIAHFLGVDHCGHRYGPNHSEMKRKLKQMDEFIFDLYQKMDEDTILFVFGDHGMDMKGDHGGESNNEIEAGLIVLSKKKIRNYYQQNELFMKLNLLNENNSYNELINGNQINHVFNDKVRTVNQIDFVPTFSLLMGLEVPFNNLGKVILDLFLSDVNDVGFINYLKRNIKQIYTYLNEYNKLNSNDPLHINDELLEYYNKFNDVTENVNNKENVDVNDLKQLILNSYQFFNLNLNNCKNRWAQFNQTNIQMGLFLLLVSCIILACEVMFKTYPTKQYEKNFNLRMGRLLSLLFGTGFIGGICGLLGVTKVTPALEDNFIFSILASSVIGYFINFGYEIIENESIVKFNIKNIVNVNYNSMDLFFIVNNIITILFIIFTNASVNLVISEDSLIYYLLVFYHVGLICYLKFYLNNNNNIDNRSNIIKTNSNKLIQYSLALLLLFTIQYQITICREEQMEYCKPTFYNLTNILFNNKLFAMLSNVSNSLESFSTITSYPVILISLIVAFLLKNLIVHQFKQTKSYFTSAPIWMDYLFPVYVVLIILYYFIDNNNITLINENPVYFDLLNFIKIYLIRLTISLFLITGLFLFFSNPLLINVEMIQYNNTNTDDKDNNNSVIHSMVVLGIGNGYGAPILLFLSIIYLLLISVQLPMGSIVVSLGFVAIIIYSNIVDLIKEIYLLLPRGDNNRSSILPNSLQISFILWLFLVSKLIFFSTGHQATLSSLQWNIGFVGLYEKHNLLSPLLIILNTTSGQILIALAMLYIYYFKSEPNLNKLYTTIPHCLMRYFNVYFLIFSLDLAFSSLWAGYHQRHLMVWKLFAPRYIFAVVTCFSAISVNLFVTLFFPSVIVLNEVTDILTIIENKR
ncbi:hypothetical protein K502DRAFT_322595 [Neoconidiobolus thromboides FSU 785]|nr:hypothetical protein K502DRAFT_322595 [Neoconidiobolus thromboides FSU 785]